MQAMSAFQLLESTVNFCSLFSAFPGGLKIRKFLSVAHWNAVKETGGKKLKWRELIVVKCSSEFATTRMPFWMAREVWNPAMMNTFWSDFQKNVVFLWFSHPVRLDSIRFSQRQKHQHNLIHFSTHHYKQKAMLRKEFWNFREFPIQSHFLLCLFLLWNSLFSESVVCLSFDAKLNLF